METADELLDLSGAATRLGCTKRWILALHKEGTLRAVSGVRGQGTMRFSARELDALKLRARGTHAPAKKGVLAAKMFHAFAAGLTLVEIVTTYQVEPEYVRRMYDEWRTPLEKSDAFRERERRRVAQEREDREARMHERRVELETLRSRRPIVVVPADAPGNRDPREARRAVGG